MSEHQRFTDAEVDEAIAVFRAACRNGIPEDDYHRLNAGQQAIVHAMLADLARRIGRG